MPTFDTLQVPTRQFGQATAKAEQLGLEWIPGDLDGNDPESQPLDVSGDSDAIDTLQAFVFQLYQGEEQARLMQLQAQE